MIQDLFRHRRPLGAAMFAAILACGTAQAADIDVRGVDSPRAAVARALATEAFTQMKIGESIILRGLPVGDRRLDLELERFSVWTEDAQFFIDDRVREKPGIVLLRGTVAGDASSRVVLGLGQNATNGFIETRGEAFSVSTGKRAGAANADDIRIADLAGFKFEDAGHRCGINDDNIENFAPHGVPIPPAPSQHVDRGTAPCRVARIAIDSDWEWTAERFGGDAEAAAEYALFLTAAISEIYQRDVNVRLVVPFLRTFSGNNDPYTGNTSPDPLEQVRDHWRANMGHIDRELTHLLTGADTSYGGVAYLGNVMCDKDWGYGVSSYMDGSFPYPLQMNSYSNWDLIVMAHELGHNFDSPHTHSFNPPIDNCGIDCSGNTNGTIMSYCHICDGGLINIDLRFHAQVQQVIEDYLQFDAPCNLEPTAGAGADSATTAVGVPVDIYVLANDSGPGCAAVGIASVQSPTPDGATVTIEGWNNPTGDPTGHFLRYTPAPGASGLDTFTYLTSAGQTGVVDVDVEGLRPADTVNNPQPGLTAAYYDIGGGHSVVPDFTGMTPVQESISDDLNYASTSGNAVGGPLSDNVGAVFEGFVVAPGSGFYTFSLESDDGSLLYVGDELVVDNDGLHGMETASGQIGLEQGTHAIRVEFFENGGGAGLIYRWTGPGVSGVVPASALVHAALDCGVADIAEPFGVLDLADVNSFVVGFQIQWPATDIAEPFGVWDLNDLSAFIASFLAGCQ